MMRDVRLINGRAPRERDKKARDACMDPSPLSPEPLAFLMPRHRGEYRFTSLRTTREDGRDALTIDFESTNRRSQPELIEDEAGHADCFDTKGNIATRGRVWVDAETHDVLRIERHLAGPVDIRVSSKLRRKYGFEDWIVLDRDDLTTRYRRVSFDHPDEVLLLPEAVDTLEVFRGGLQSTRRRTTFSGYRRFLTAGRITKSSGR